MMNLFRKILPLAALTAILVSLAYLADAAAPGPKVSAQGNKHNLSSLNLDLSVKYKAAAGDLRGEQICIFCHTPHRANVTGHTPLWNRKFSGETFQRYTSATLRIRGIANAQYGNGAQPNGSSRLCLSCHDGVSALGAVGPLDAAPDIVMDTALSGGFDYITGLASFKPDTDKMKTGHHPVSFVYMTNFNYGVTPQTGTIHSQLPAAEYRFMPISAAYKVKLFDTSRNGNGWMQCTTCHDPHQNQSEEDKCYDGGGAPVGCDGTNTRKVAPFWTYHGLNTAAAEDTGTVCKVCHTVSAQGSYAPWPTTATYP